MLLRSTCLAVALSALACGGRVLDAEPTDSGAAGADSQRDSETDGSGPMCRLSDGTPTCGFSGCPNPHPDGCASCPLAANRELETAPFGVCPEDAEKVFAQVSGSGARCATCPSEDDVCLFRGVDYACVHRPLCDAFASVGFKGCFFQDLSDYVPGPLPGGACPRTGVGLCGGACGPCAAGSICVGRSHAHPFGVCAPLTTASNKLARGCSRRPSSSAEACVGDEECLVFSSEDDTVQKAADEAGLCLARGRCRDARAIIPGGVFCVDGSGNELP